MSWDLHDYRLVTASAYPGMMAPLTEHASCICVLAGDADRQRAGGPVAALSLEALDGVRRRWRFGDVARLADFVPKVLAEAPADDRPLLLIPPRASCAWENAAASWPADVSLAASPTRIVEPIAEDKIFVRHELARLGVPVPEAVVPTAAEVDFGTLAKRLGTPFVLQSPNGAGGQGTYLIRAAADLAAALAKQPHVEGWLASRFSGETTINVSGVVHSDGTQLLPVSVQASGIAELGFGFGGYCGSDFAADGVPARVAEEAYRHAAVIGEWLRGRGHRGLFGVDIAVEGHDLAALEVNPRIQGSSWLLSRAQQREGRTACLESHVQALLGRPLGLHRDAAAPEELERPGSHLIVRWQGPASVVRDVPLALSTDSVAVTALPGVGVTLLPGAILGRLESEHSLATADGHGLTARARGVVDALLAGIGTEPAPAR